MLAKKYRLPLQGIVGAAAPRAWFVVRKPDVSIKVFRSSLPYTRVGVIVPKHIEKSAVKRNALRRAVFNSWSGHMFEVKGVDYCYVVHRAMLQTPLEVLQQELRHASERV